MFVRLAFAVQALLCPDVLLMDEVLSVGDIFFQQKCHARMESLIARGTAVVLVTHDMGAVEKYCSRCLLLDGGRARFLGPPIEAVQVYMSPAREAEGGGEETRTDQAPSARLPGSRTASPEPPCAFAGDIPGLAFPPWPGPEAFIDLSRAFVVEENPGARLSAVAILDGNGRPAQDFATGDTAFFCYEFTVQKDIEAPVGGIFISTDLNITLHGRSSLQLPAPAPERVENGGRVRFRQAVTLGLTPGWYVFMLAFGSIPKEDYAPSLDLSRDGLHPRLSILTRVARAGAFRVTARKSPPNLPFLGYVDLPGAVSVSVLPPARED